MVRYFTFYLFIIVAACFVQSGCNIINPAEPVPTYVHIDSFNMQGNANVTGTLSHKITNVWVYYNNQSVGVFNLPVTVPIITEGNNGVLRLQPGIDANGFSTIEIPYPFYRSDTVTITSQPGKVINYLPTTSYYSLKLKYNETFEGGSSLTPLFGVPPVLTTDPTKVFEGTRACRIYLPNPGDSSVSATNTNFSLPTDQESWLEINYKSTVNVQFGLTTIDNLGILYTEYLIGLRPRSDWGKIYISLRDFAAAHQGTSYNVLIRTEGSDTGGGEVNLDNIKVVSF